MQQTATILQHQKVGSSAKLFLKKKQFNPAVENEQTGLSTAEFTAKKMEEVACIGDYYTYGYRE